METKRCGQCIYRILFGVGGVALYGRAARHGASGMLRLNGSLLRFAQRTPTNQAGSRSPTSHGRAWGRYPGYQWELKVGVVNLMPRSDAPFLRTRITKFQMNATERETRAIGIPGATEQMSEDSHIGSYG